MHYFFDSAIIRKWRNARVLPGRLEKHPCNPLWKEGFFAEPALPWEVRIDNGYPNVFFDPLKGKYRCYYTCIVRDAISENTPLSIRKNSRYQPTKERVTALLYAESADGIRWEKPALGLVNFDGSAQNNILMLHLHGAGVMLDLDEPDETRRYKLVARVDGEGGGLCAAFSADGIHFSQPVRIHADLKGDSHNAVLKRKDGKYLLYTRMFHRRLRTVGRLVSKDFLNWHDEREVLAGNGLNDQAYAMPVFEQDGWYWGLCAIYHGGDEAAERYDHVDVELCCSDDGFRWQRIAPGIPFLPNGSGEYGQENCACDAGCCFASLPTADGEQLCFYYMGGNGTHYGFRETGLCLATIDRQKLVGVRAVDEEKAFTVQTVPMRSSAGCVNICADVAPDGRICYALLDENGCPVEGFTEETCKPFTQSGKTLRLEWTGEESWPQTWMLKITCQKAVLYQLDGDYTLV